MLRTLACLLTVMLFPLGAKAEGFAEPPLSPLERVEEPRPR
jgi:hypothetical protein